MYLVIFEDVEYWKSIELFWGCTIPIDLKHDWKRRETQKNNVSFPEELQAVAHVNFVTYRNYCAYLNVSGNYHVC